MRVCRGGVGAATVSTFFLVFFWHVVSEDDSQCLQMFKKSVQDPQGFLSAWNFVNGSQGYVCNFFGVTCWNSQENKIMSLKFPKAGLSGTFPSGLRQCMALQDLDLSQNNFSGDIPPDLCMQIPYITSLDLSQNSLSGSIPTNLEDCLYLYSLHLQQNRLSGQLPGGIGVLPRLTSLNVSSNLLTGPIPSTFTDRSLTSDNPVVSFPASAFDDNPGLCGPPTSKACSSKSNTAVIVSAIVGSAAVFAAAGALCLWFVFFQAHKKENAVRQEDYKWVQRIRTPKSVKVFLFEEPVVKLQLSDLMAATNDFDKNYIIGTGKTGTVYKALLPDGSMLAVKRLHLSSHLGKDFQSEMDTLGSLRHRNLVPLLGFCVVGQEKLLVYKHMVNGSLQEYLHNTPIERKPFLTTRLKIGIGASRGLAWLHHSCNPRIIHGSISSSSILIDDDYEPRITDFGLARLVSLVDTHVSTSIDGDFGDVGYVAPEYYRTLVASVKGDVYSFGVVLLELVSGRKPNNVCTEKGFNGNLADWVAFLSSNGSVEEALDTSLKGKGYDNELSQFLRVACACVLPVPKDRPTMYEVYQLLMAIGEKMSITDDDSPPNTDVDNMKNLDELTA